MQRTINPNRLALFNWVLTSYFVLLFLAYLFNIQWTMIGVIIEMLTLPFFFGQFVLLYLSIKAVKANRNNKTLVTSTLALLLCSIITCVTVLISFT